MATNCLTIDCRGVPLKGRKKCQSCRYKEWKFKNPLRVSYIRLKSNAKARGIKFSLTLEEFSKFCNETDYLKKRGVGKHDLTIDRIKNNKGYSYSNMQVLTKVENSKKHAKGLDGWSVEADRDGVPF